MRTLLGIAGACLLIITSTPAGPANAGSRHQAPDWHPVGVDTDQQFRGLDATDRRHAWVSGSAGGVWKTHDGGQTWTDVSPARGRGPAAPRRRDPRPGHVLVLSVGEAGDSRIFRTTDGGATWTQPFVNDDPAAFYDCMGMFPGGRRGLAMSDPVDGKFRIIETTDGGATWSVVDPAGMPEAVEGEFGSQPAAPAW